MEIAKEPTRTGRLFPVLTVILSVLLVLMILLYVLQLRFVMLLVETAVDLVEAEVLRELPEGVDPQEVRDTFARVKEAVPRRKIDFRKARDAATYAQRARDGGWTADEVETLLNMMNTAMGVQKEKD